MLVACDCGCCVFFVRVCGLGSLVVAVVCVFVYCVCCLWFLCVLVDGAFCLGLSSVSAVSFLLFLLIVFVMCACWLGLVFVVVVRVCACWLY